MKKNLIAAALVVALTSGCSMMGGGEDESLSVADVNTRASELTVKMNENGGYQMSSIKTLEQVRIPINTLYTSSVEILNHYSKSLEKYEDGAQLQTLVNMERSNNGDAGAKTLLESYQMGTVEGVEPEAAKKMYADYVSMINDEDINKMNIEIVKVAVTLAVEVYAFTQLDQSALLKDVDFKTMHLEMDRISVTTDQLSIMTDAFSTLNAEYDANKAAGLIK